MVDNMSITKDIMSEVNELEQKASILYPDNPAMQYKWINAINYLRGGKGWILDCFITKKEQK
jgi:hypothetical protein